MHFGAHASSTAIGRGPLRVARVTPFQPRASAALGQKPIRPLWTRKRPWSPRAKQPISHPPNQPVSAIANDRRKKRDDCRQRARKPAARRPQCGNHPGRPKQELGKLTAAPIRRIDERVEVLRRQPMGTQIMLRGRPLQWPKSQDGLPIEAQQKSDDTVAQPAFPVEEQDGMAVRCSWSGGWWRLLHRDTFNLGPLRGKSKTPGLRERHPAVMGLPGRRDARPPAGRV